MTGPNQIDLEQTEPVAGSLCQTLVTYADQAQLLHENEEIAPCTLLHPAWYELEGAIGFAGPGLLRGQLDGER